LHDPLAVACLLDPAVVEVGAASVTVERTDPTTYGATRFSFAVGKAVGAPVMVALRADHDRFLDVLCTALDAGPAIG
jgi:inosine-uridine nucleoside N-ribohydrolase